MRELSPPGTNQPEILASRTVFSNANNTVPDTVFASNPQPKPLSHTVFSGSTKTV